MTPNDRDSCIVQSRASHSYMLTHCSREGVSQHVCTGGDQGMCDGPTVDRRGTPSQGRWVFLSSWLSPIGKVRILDRNLVRLAGLSSTAGPCTPEVLSPGLLRGRAISSVSACPFEGDDIRKSRLLQLLLDATTMCLPECMHGAVSFVAAIRFPEKTLRETRFPIDRDADVPQADRLGARANHTPPR